MPKRRAPVQFPKPVNPVHPSLSTSAGNKNASRHRNPPTTTGGTSINDRIQHLRISQAPPASKESRSQAQTIQHTVHPSLRAILQIPETPSPRPRADMRLAGGRRARGPAGPPPPTSWLNDSIHAPSHLRLRAKSNRDAKLVGGEGVERLGELPGINLPAEGSLLHLTLKTMAGNWDWHLQYDRYYLPTLPVRYKQALLYFVACYSPRSVTCYDLDVLYSDEMGLEGATGSDGLTHLDLSTSIGYSLDLKDLKTFFTKKPGTIPHRRISSESIAIPDSWDAPPMNAVPSFTVDRFPALTHLSLSYPNPGSWMSILSLSTHLATITHLSLSHWPVPSLTPNSIIAYRTTPRGNVDYGASNFYSLYDGNFSEAAGVLRRFSRATYCLKWLDLTGCGQWLRALACLDGVDWCGAWRGVEVVKVGQGWIPACLREEGRQWKDVFKDCSDPEEDDENWKKRKQLMRWVDIEKDTEIIIAEIEKTMATTANIRAVLAAEDREMERSSAPDTWWGKAPKRISANGEEKVRARSGKVRFERGWEGWWIEDAIGKVPFWMRSPARPGD